MKIAVRRSGGLARHIDGGDERYRVVGHVLELRGVAGQGISSNIGEGNAPRIHSFAIELRISVPEKTPESFAWLAAFSAGEALSQDGEAGTLAAGWTTDGDLRVTLYGASLAAWRRLTIPGHVEAYAGKVVTLRIVRDAVAGTLTVEQDGVALEGDETTSGTAPDWDADIQAAWLHVCGAKDQPGISAGYVGRVHAVKYTIHSFRSEAVLWLDAAHVSDSAPQALINRGGQKGTVGDAQFGSASGADTNDPLWLTGSGYVYLPGLPGNYIAGAYAPDLSGNSDIRIRVLGVTWATGASRYVVSQWLDGGGRSWVLYINSSGQLVMQYSLDGTNIATSPVSPTSLPAAGVADGEDVFLRVTRLADNGSGGRVTTFYFSRNGTTWTQLGNAVTQSGTGGYYPSSAQLKIGTVNNGTTPNVAEFRAIYLEVRSDIDGPVVARFDASQCGQTGYTDSINSTVWTVNRATSGRKTVVKDTDEPLLLFGADDYLSVADDDALDFGVGQAFSVVAFIRQWDTPTSFGRYVAKGSGTTVAGWTLQNHQTNHRVWGFIGNPDGTAPQGGTATWSNGDLVGVVLRRNSDGTAQTGLVGGSFATWSNNANLDCSNTATLRVGATSSGTMPQDFEFRGAAIFRRYLTDAELVALEREMLWELEQATGTTYGPTVLEWDFSAPKLTLPDLSGNGLDGELSAEGYVRRAYRWRPRRRRVVDGGWWGDGEPQFLINDPWRARVVADGGEDDFRPGDWRVFQLVPIEHKRVVAGSSEPTITTDSAGRIVEVMESVETITDYQLDIAWSLPQFASEVTFEALDPSRATVDAAGTVTGIRTSAGSWPARIRATSADGYVTEITLPITRTAGSTVEEVIGYAEDGLAYAVDQPVREAIAGLTPSTLTKRIYTTQNHTDGIYVRNPACWGAGFDLTCISPWNSHGGVTRAGIAFTPQHIGFARHYRIAKGSQIRFVTADNEVVVRTMVDWRDVVGAFSPIVDLTIGVLDEPLPESISYAAVFPADVTDWFSIYIAKNDHRLGSFYRLPLLYTDQEEKLHIGMLSTLGESLAGGTLPSEVPAWMTSLWPYAAIYNGWGEGVVGGDSGSPFFVIIDGRVVWVTCATGGGGPAVHTHVDNINAAIAALDASALGYQTGFTCDVINLESFTKYHA